MSRLRFGNRFYGGFIRRIPIMRSDRALWCAIPSEEFEQIAQAECWKEAENRLASSGNGEGREWSSNYISKKHVNERLEELKTSDPKHPVFA